MCRLLAVVSTGGGGIAHELGRAGCQEFLSLSTLHADGWGVASVAAGSGGLAVRRGLGAGHASPSAASLLASPAVAGIAHLRMASAGMAVGLDAVHPFVADGMAFAHNGFITPVARLRRLAGPGVALGETDSQLYFRLVRDQVRRRGDVLEGTVAAVRSIRARFPEASLNALILTPRELVVVQASAAAVSPLAARATETLPDGHGDSYFQLYRRRSADGSVAVASSGIDVQGWDPLEQETVVVMDLRTWESRVTALSGQCLETTS